MTSGPVLPEGLERVGEVTEERGTSRDEAATAGGAGESDVAVTRPAAAALPRVVAAAVPEAAAAAVPAAEMVAGPVPAGGSAAAFGSGSSSPSATQQVAQSQAEETRLCADPEQTGEVALSASPAPVTSTVLAAVVSAATGEQGGVPAAEGAPTAAACARTPIAAAAANRQEHGQGEGESLGPANSAAFGAVQAKSKKNLRAQPAPRRPGAGLGPGFSGPLLGWVLQGQPPPVQACPSSSAQPHAAGGALAIEEILLLLANVVNRLASSFQSQLVRDLLLPSCLIALKKPGGGVRPIAMGEALLRVVAKAALHSLGPQIREFFLPVQFGIAILGGAEWIIYTVRSLLKEDETRTCGECVQ
ncbi:unnamed protein product [Closterium sp. Naga37s-1]|nr:unnamed protein product [Closterium sp. Naga37s-1]